MKTPIFKSELPICYLLLVIGHSSLVFLLRAKGQ